MAKGMVVIDRDRCKGCELCVIACPSHVLRLAESGFNLKGYRPVEVADAEACTGCAVCAIICPDVVFTVYKARRESKTTSAGAA